MTLTLGENYLPRCQQPDAMKTALKYRQNTSMVVAPDWDIWRRNKSTAFNMVYIKIEKVGGTTVAGVVRQIALRFKLDGKRQKQWIKHEPGIYTVSILRSLV